MPARTGRLTRPRRAPRGGRASGAPFPWIVLALVAASLLASLLPGRAAFLQYDRGAVSAGQPWRLITGQLVHWSPRMTFVDLGMLAALGLWVERRSRALVTATLAAAAALVAAAVHLCASEVALYRGSSGLAAAVFTVVALLLLRDGSHCWVRRSLGALALLLLVAKTAWEMREGVALVAGRLPDQVSVTPVAHLAGALAGLAVFAAWSLFERRAAGPA